MIESLLGFLAIFVLALLRLPLAFAYLFDDEVDPDEDNAEFGFDEDDEDEENEIDELFNKITDFNTAINSPCTTTDEPCGATGGR